MGNLNIDFKKWLDFILAPVDEPGSRLFHWNIVVAFLLVALWIIFTYGFDKTPTKLHQMVFNKKYWWNRSTKFDYQIYFLNSLFKVALFIPFLDFSFGIAKSIARLLNQIFPEHTAWGLDLWPLFIFTVMAFIWDDFLRFFHHMLMHKIPILWKFHSVHHSAKILTPVTLYRAHPVESAIATLRNSLSLGLVTGVFVFCFSRPLTLWTLLGVNVFGFLFNLLGANLRHSHIPIGFGKWIETIFISPRQHQIHHSSALEHRDKNFGVSLSIWDKLIGSWVSSKEVKNKKLNFGLGDRQKRSFWSEMGFERKK